MDEAYERDIENLKDLSVYTLFRCLPIKTRNEVADFLITRTRAVDPRLSNYICKIKALTNGFPTQPFNGSFIDNEIKMEPNATFTVCDEGASVEAPKELLKRRLSEMQELYWKNKDKEIKRKSNLSLRRGDMQNIEKKEQRNSLRIPLQNVKNNLSSPKVAAPLTPHSPHTPVTASVLNRNSKKENLKIKTEVKEDVPIMNFDDLIPTSANRMRISPRIDANDTFTVSVESNSFSPNATVPFTFDTVVASEHNFGGTLVNITNKEEVPTAKLDDLGQTVNSTYIVSVENNSSPPNVGYPIAPHSDVNRVHRSEDIIEEVPIIKLDDLAQNFTDGIRVDSITDANSTFIVKKQNFRPSLNETFDYEKKVNKVVSDVVASDSRNLVSIKKENSERVSDPRECIRRPPEDAFDEQRLRSAILHTIDEKDEEKPFMTRGGTQHRLPTSMTTRSIGAVRTETFIEKKANDSIDEITDIIVGGPSTKYPSLASLKNDPVLNKNSKRFSNAILLRDTADALKTIKPFIGSLIADAGICYSKEVDRVSGLAPQESYHLKQLAKFMEAQKRSEAWKVFERFFDVKNVPESYPPRMRKGLLEKVINSL